MQSRGLIFILLTSLLALAASQPLYGFEKQILYSFQDPEDIQWMPDVREAPGRSKRSRLLNLVGPNSRFTDPYRARFIKKKIRSVPIELIDFRPW